MRERAGSRRRAWRLVLLGVLVVGAYGGLLVLYAISGHTSGFGETAGPPPGGVVVEVKFTAIEGNAGRMSVSIDLADVDESLAGATGLVLRRPLTLVIDPSAGVRQIVVPAGQIPPLTRLELELNGDIRQWPLDQYSADVVVGVFDGEPDRGRTLPLAVRAGGEVEGWRVTARQEPADADAGALQFVGFTLDARRSGSTLAFALILLAILVALPVIALAVAVNTRWRSRRSVQPTFMSWLAAMLFATVPLRNFLPGSPPPGSWIDAVIVLWVIVGLVVALAIYASAWYREFVD